MCGLLVAPALVAPARADYASDARALKSVREVLNSKEGAPAERLARAQQMISAAQVSPRIEVMMVRDVANFQRRQLKDNALAIQTTEAGIAKYVDVPERSRLIGYKIELLGLGDPATRRRLTAKRSGPPSPKATPSFGRTWPFLI